MSNEAGAVKNYFWTIDAALTSAFNMLAELDDFEERSDMYEALVVMRELNDSILYPEG